MVEVEVKTTGFSATGLTRPQRKRGTMAEAGLAGSAG